MRTPRARHHALSSAWSRPDDFALSTVLLGRSLQALLVVLAVAVAVAEVLRPVLGPAGLGLGRGPWWGAVPVVDARLAPSVEVATTPPLPVLVGGPYGPGEAVESFVGDVSLQLWTPDAPQRLLLVALPVLAGAVALAVVVQLFRLAGALAAGDPFSPRSRARLWRVALLVGVAGQAVAVAGALVRWWVLSDDRLATWVSPDATVSFVPLAVGGAVAVLAHALDVADRRSTTATERAAAPSD